MSPANLTGNEANGTTLNAALKDSSLTSFDIEKLFYQGNTRLSWRPP
jgi:hypothetical protein